MKKTEIDQTLVRGGGGVPPLWLKTKLFPVFSFEDIPKLIKLKLLKAKGHIFSEIVEQGCFIFNNAGS